MSDHYRELTAVLARVRRRWRTLSGLTALTRAVVAASTLALAALVAYLVASPSEGGVVVLFLLPAAGLLIAAGWFFWSLRRRPDDRTVARLIEERCPELEDQLATAVELGGRGDEGGASVLLAPLLAEGKLRLVDLFKGRQQLLVYHFMWRWEKGRPLDEPCRGCSGWADEIARGHLSQLHRRNTELVLVSRAPLAKITPFKQRMGWTLPWYSSAGSSFNHDYHVSFDESVAPIVYNYRTKAEHIAAGTGGYVEGEQPFDMPGMSAFLRQGDEVYHTYSTYARGLDGLWGMYQWLDRAPKGRNETGVWWRRHDEYDKG